MGEKNTQCQDLDNKGYCPNTVMTFAWKQEYNK